MLKQFILLFLSSVVKTRVLYSSIILLLIYRDGFYLIEKLYVLIFLIVTNYIKKYTYITRSFLVPALTIDRKFTVEDSKKKYQITLNWSA